MFRFIKETREELKKVNFPNKKELFKNTSIVITFTTMLTIFVFTIDTILNIGLSLILK